MKTVAGANKAMADAANVSAEAAKRTASTSAQQLEFTDRPWVRVESVAVARPIVFERIPYDFTIPALRDLRDSGKVELPERAVSFATAIALKNTGRSVASDIRLASQVVFFGPTFASLTDYANEMTTRMCNVAAIMPHTSELLYPGDRLPKYSGVYEPIPAANITPPRSFETRRADAVEMLLVGCVAYTFSNATTPPSDLVHLQTR
jgi:hypothetical protein